MSRTRFLAVVVALAVATSAAAIAAAPLASASNAGSEHYTVQSGDSFSSIATRFGVSANGLARANGMRLSGVLLVGRVLIVPAPSVPTTLPAKLRRHPDRLALYPVFVAAAKEAGVPADLLMSVAYMESGWQRWIVSADGAIGVGQLLPATAWWLSRDVMGEPWLDPYRAQDNIRMSAHLLRILLDANDGRTAAALISYFEGPGAMARTGVTPVAASYAAVVMAARRYFR
jgi:soluble lytic murein transglycosylase-like protein